jgi:hypothetical protein
MTPEQRLADAIERLGRAEAAHRDATVDSGGRPVALTDRTVGLLEDGHQRTPKQIVSQLAQGPVVE